MLRDLQLYCSWAGISTDEKLTLHCLRKSYAQTLADNSTPISTLKKLMGHSSIQTTMEFYLKSSDANEQRAVEALDKLMIKEKQVEIIWGLYKIERLKGNIVRETENAVLFDVVKNTSGALEGRKCWFPKAKVKMPVKKRQNCCVYIPEWLYDKKVEELGKKMGW